MKLNHATQLRYIESIKENGLLVNETVNSHDTKDGYLSPHRPKHLPDIVDLARCVYFSPDNSAYGFDEHPWIRGSSVQVLSRNLDKDKTYAAPVMESFKLSEMMLSTRRERRANLVNSNEFIELCISYWEKFVPFSVYQAKYGHIKFMEDQCKNVEVLYFGDIPPSKIIFR